jgi:hypothetical protein
MIHQSSAKGLHHQEQRQLLGYSSNCPVRSVNLDSPSESPGEQGGKSMLVPDVSEVCQALRAGDW